MTITPTTTAPPTVKLACPNSRCLSTDQLVTLEQIAGEARTAGISRDAAGAVDVDFTGDTEVNWDSSTTVGVKCQACDWWYEGDDWADKLLTPAQVEALET